MAFDLYITFSGLCMLVRRKDELHVLLPRTHDAHKHIAVIGSHRKYQPEVGGSSPFVEYELGAGPISLEDLETDQGFSARLDAFEIADMGGCVGDRRNPNAVYAQLVLNQGSPCPLAVCENHGGAVWKFKGEDRRLSTSLHWRIRDVQEDMDGREGLSVRVITAAGPSIDVKLRPVQGQIRMYLFHTLPDERPSSGPPQPKPIQAGTPAPHFGHYFDLFAPLAQLPARCHPVFTSDREEFVAELDAGSASVQPGSPAARRRRLVQENFVGRRYSCVLATVAES